MTTTPVKIIFELESMKDLEAALSTYEEARDAHPDIVMNVENRVRQKEGERKIVEKEKNWKEEKGKAIIDVLAYEGVTYDEAYLILKSAEWELGKRKGEETNGKRISKK